MTSENTKPIFWPNEKSISVKSSVATEDIHVRVASQKRNSFHAREPRDMFRKVTPRSFEYDEVPTLIASLAHDFSAATGIDPSGVIVAATTAAAGAIDDRHKLEVNRGTNWYVSARQWSVLCGPPSAGKSPAIRVAVDPLKRIHEEGVMQWHAENKGLKREEMSPQPATYLSDATIPALSERLRDNPQGVIVLNEEFASWVGAIDSSDRGEAAKNRGDWLQLRDGGGRQIERIGRGSIFVPNWGASVLAACTPDGLAKQMKCMPEDGLIQRFVPCMMQSALPDHSGECVARLSEWNAAIRWAKSETMQRHGVVGFAGEAREMFEFERREIIKLVRQLEEYMPAYAAHLGKHPGMLAEVALIFHVFSGKGIGGCIDEMSMIQAISYMQRVRQHAYYMYSSVLQSSPAFELAQALARSIAAAQSPMPCIGRDYMTQHCQLFKRADDKLRREAIAFLEDADWLEAEFGGRTYGGWPAKYMVHPKVFSKFAREGTEWRARRAAVVYAIGGEGVEG